MHKFLYIQVRADAIPGDAHVPTARCPAILEHTRQSRADFGLGLSQFQRRLQTRFSCSMHVGKRPLESAFDDVQMSGWLYSLPIPCG